jgi:hypothetical protein
VAGDDLRFYVELADERAEAQSEGLHPHQVDFFFQQPARIVFAKSGRLNERRGFICIGIWGERGFRGGKHQILNNGGAIQIP